MYTNTPGNINAPTRVAYQQHLGPSSLEGGVHDKVSLDIIHSHNLTNNSIVYNLRLCSCE